MLPNDLQDLGNVDVYPLTVPPLLFAVVTGEEDDFSAVGQNVFDLYDVRL